MPGVISGKLGITVRRDSQTFRNPLYFCCFSREKIMKKLSIVHAIVGAALLCMTPLSVHWSPVKGESISFALETAKAAELQVPPYRRAHRHYYRAAYYDLYCGGPYVGGGWNGGTYWGGPWMDLRCYYGGVR
jgi:hypothetical protein